MPVYEIRVKGHLDQRWSAWFDGMTITNEANGDAIISGPLVDQAGSGFAGQRVGHSIEQ